MGARRALSIMTALTASVVLFAGCNVSAPTGGTDSLPTETLATYPAPTSISCATVEAELATVNEIISNAAKNFGDDPYAALTRMRGAITYLEELRDVAADVELKQLLNEVTVEGVDLIDTIERVMHNGTLLTEFDQIADGADRLEGSLNNLLEYCRF